MIVQFGTSRFLQAHADLFASEARDAGQKVPGITVVQTTGNADRARRLGAFSDPDGFPVIVRGIESGQPIDRTIRVRSVVRGLQAGRDWQELATLVRDDATHIVSNTGDTGYDVLAGDDDAQAAPRSFPALLVELLHQRWRSGGAPLTLLPCELIPRNGDVLRERVAGLTEAQARDPAFIDWLRSRCVWTNTLVDRIVSAPLEPAGAIAEPYALWAIERAAGLAMPFTHPSIVLTDDLEPFERLKLHVLNLGHSWLAERWSRQGASPGRTVRELVTNRETRTALDRLMTEEVVPGFAARGLEESARAYVATTIERFENPFLDHLLSDIYAHHATKIDRRIGGFVAWVDDAAATPPPMPELRRLAASQRMTA